MRLTKENFLADYLLNLGIVEVTMPELYYLLDELLTYEGKPIPKDTKLRAKKMLPAWCSQSFEYKAKK